MNTLTLDESRFIGDFFISYGEGNIKLQYIIVNYYFATLYKISPYANAFINTILTFIIGQKFIENFSYLRGRRNTSYFFILFLLPANIFFLATFLRDYNVFLMSLIVMIAIARGNYKWFYVSLIFTFFLRFEASLFFLIAFYISRYKHNFFRYMPFYLFFLFLLIEYGPLYEIIVNRTLAQYDSAMGLGVFEFPFERKFAFLAVIINWPMYFFPMFNYEAKTIFHYFLLVDSVISLILVIMAILFYSKNIFLRDRVYRFSVYMVSFALLAAIPESHELAIVRHKLMYMPFIFYLAFANFKNKISLWKK